MKPVKLPKGWIRTTLGEIARPGRFRVLPQEYLDLPYIGLGHIESQTMQRLGQGDASDVRSSSILFEKGDILYGKMRPYLNKVWVAEFSGLCSAEFLVFPGSEELNSEFLALRLNAEDFVNFANQQVSGERPRVDFKALSSFPIYLPPFAEQNRIADKLKASLTQIHASVTTTQRATERLAKYRNAVLQAAVTGELTRAWRKNHSPKETGEQLLQQILKTRRARWEESELQHLRKVDRTPKNDKWKSRYPEITPPKTDNLHILPRSWAWATIEQLAIVGSGNTPQGIKIYIGHQNGGVCWFKVSDMNKAGNETWMTLSETKFTQKVAFGLGLTIFPKASIIFPKRGGAIATGKKRRLAAPACLDTNLMALTTLAEIGEYFWIWFQSIDLARLSSGSSIPQINNSDIMMLPVPLPSLTEQAEIVREVERRLLAADRLAIKLNNQLTQVHTLRQSLFNNAFAGHLIPQNPKDEPASVLLENTRATRQSKTKRRNAIHMPKSKLKSETIHSPLFDVIREHKNPITPEELFTKSGYQNEFNGSDEPQGVVDAFYAELRMLTDKPAKVSEEKNSEHQVFLRIIP